MTIALRTIGFLLILCCTAFIYSAIHDRSVQLSHFDFLSNHHMLSIEEKPDLKDWHFSAYPNQIYRFGLSDKEVVDGKTSLFIINKLPSKNGVAAVRQSIKAQNFHSKKIEFSGYFKASNLAGDVTLMLDILDDDDDIIRRADVKFNGTNSDLEWQQFSIVADIPANSSALSYSGFLHGSGQVWFDNFKIKLAPDNATDISYPISYTLPKDEAPSAERTKYLNIVGYNTEPVDGFTLGAQIIDLSTWFISDALDGEYQASNEDNTLLLESLIDAPDLGVVLKRYNFNATNPLKLNVKGIKFRAQMKHQFVKSVASIWMRIEDKETNPLAFDNLRYTSSGGTSDWQDFEVTLAIDENAAIISFGALLVSKGKLWLRNPHIEYVYEPVQRNTHLLIKPSNLSFE